MSTRASENTCWFPNRLLGHYNRSSFIRRERLGSISSLGSLGLPFRGMWMVVTRSSQKKRVPVGPCITRACPTSWPFVCSADYSSVCLTVAPRVRSHTRIRQRIFADLQKYYRTYIRVRSFQLVLKLMRDETNEYSKLTRILSRKLIGNGIFLNQKKLCRNI